VVAATASTKHFWIQVPRFYGCLTCTSGICCSCAKLGHAALGSPRRSPVRTMSLRCMALHTVYCLCRLLEAYNALLLHRMTPDVRMLICT
jgi:hypothetical protein